ncbi:helix-hairpin-helix domain-containing protein [Blastopirellula sp. JC732]|uniref:Helix-hairpin-helix domain-containing protein n=1 Tax=Blastopirellula sediminis TaxID=2894196 RepID=A0A9X1SJ02_9BACT|nr:helix-hairpin-helix domain-containing protein [Blastopirellula sediminis]MCC9604543.1 helix-hairpin-helix domain-containing protein [Blastopirellula sediminis]MCC9632158.1 helix-hairpin-helix domain-containing protein [Blastopirellula sediminis]
MSPASPPPKSNRRLRWTLRRGDQLAAVIVLLVLIVGTSIYAWRDQNRRSRSIHIEHVEPLPAAFVVDINQADWPELTQLPGIGETLARRIVESRAAEGPFLDHNDLQRVRGIGPRTLERLKPHLLPAADVETIAGDLSPAEESGS